MKLWLRLLGYVAPYRAALAVALVSMVLLAITTGTYPLLLDLLTTLLIQGAHAGATNLESSLDGAARVAGALGLRLDRGAVAEFLRAHVIPLFAVVVLLKGLAQASRFFAMGFLAQKVIRDLRAELFGRMVRQGAGFFGGQASGHLVSRLMNDVAQVERAATYALPVLIGDALRVFALGGVCLVQYPKLSLVSLVVVPLAVGPIVVFGRALKRYARRGQQAIAELTHRISETLGGIRVVQTYGREEYEIKRFLAESDRYVAVMMKSVLVRAVQTPAMELVGVLALLLTIGYAVGQVERGAIRPGEVVGFLLALVLLYEPVKAIGRLNGIVLPGLAAAERVFEIVDRPPDVLDRPGARALLGPAAEVRFEQVSFRYHPEAPLVLEGLELKLERGKMVALVGSSGSGKSTVAALLPRLFDVTAGAIRVDGQDIREVTQDSLRAQLALVSQETYLFNDTIRANIAYGLPGASDVEIEAAARKAHAHGFITALPAGYSTRTGERGVTLSGGQRQRIAIARAFLKNAPILILDEATSALDVESEREVQSAIDALIQDRAALVIAHRLSTIRRADEIVVLEGGRVRERGTHAELVARGGTYARLLRLGEDEEESSCTSSIVS